MRELGDEGEAAIRDYRRNAPTVVAAMDAAPPEERDATYKNIHLRMLDALFLLDQGREAEA